MLSSAQKQFYHYLDRPQAAAPLISFRLIFGALMIFSAARFMYLGWIEDHYLDPVFHFKYYGFEWVEPLPAWALYALHYLMMASGLGIMFLRGWAYRSAALSLFLSFSYLELIDLTYYLNHYYFVSLVSLLLVFAPAHISPFAPLGEQKIRRGALFILQAQIAIVYLYAGLAKINYDWLIEALPLRIWVPAHDQTPLIGALFSWPITPYLFSWAGMLYDCLIVFFLLCRATRPWAYLSVIIFHSLTGLMFQIGVFPLVMIGAASLFFSPQWHQKFIRFFIPERSSIAQLTPQPLATQWRHYALTVYLLFQLLFPWRYLLYPGNVFWTEEGYRFSWRVMLMEKAGTASFYVKDRATGREGIVNNRDFLNPHQEKQMAMQPDMILQFAHFLGEHYAAQGLTEPEVRAEVYVSLNARPSRLLIDPQRDLMRIKDSFKAKDWILAP